MFDLLAQIIGLTIQTGNSLHSWLSCAVLKSECKQFILSCAIFFCICLKLWESCFLVHKTRSHLRCFTIFYNLLSAKNELYRGCDAYHSISNLKGYYPHTLKFEPKLFS